MRYILLIMMLSSSIAFAKGGGGGHGGGHSSSHASGHSSGHSEGTSGSHSGTSSSNPAWVRSFFSSKSSPSSPKASNSDCDDNSKWYQFSTNRCKK